MPGTGPTKEELRDYWANNRQYFDELAKYYLESDREYYNKFIAPFYTSPFGAASPAKSGSAGARILILLIAVFVVIGAGAVAFFVAIKSGPDPGDDEKVISPKVIQDTLKTPEIKIKNTDDTTPVAVKTNSPYYDKAMKYYHDKDYDAAEQYFNMIDKNDKNYMNAKKKLFEIKMIRNGDPINTDVPVEPKK